MKTKTAQPKQHKDVFFTEFEGIKYPCREIKWDGQINTISVCPLNEILYDMKKGKYTSTAARHLDESILMFCEPDEINLPTRKLEKLVKESLG